mgnify:CR=1 FL=1
MSDDGFWASALAEAEAADAQDPLKEFRDRFRLPAGVIYLDGNSLGPAPEAALAALAGAAEEEWARDLITSWNKAGWFDLPTRYGDIVGRVVGAAPGQIVVCDTTSTNIYKALHACLGLRPDRSVIVAEAMSFPTDLYVTAGVKASRPDVEIRLEGGDGKRFDDLIDEKVAAILINQVDYRTGRLRDMRAATRKAHESGALAIWDLCHSAGVMEVGLDAGGADFAVGCSYKYLNGGPGAPAFIYCAERHLEAARQPLSGWWGHATPFAFDRSFTPDSGIRKFLCGTQPILSFRAMEAGLSIAAEAGIAPARLKSTDLTERFISLVETKCTDFGVRLLSPRAARERGSQVALGFEAGYAVVQALIARGVVGDFRTPDVMRFGFAPLYIRHVDVVRAARMLHDILEARVWDDPKYTKRATVT